MDKRKKRNIIRIGALMFWSILYILVKIKSFIPDQDGYIYATIAISFVGYLIYENFYRLPKIKNKKMETREHQLTTLINEKDKYEPKINSTNLPADLQNYIPIITKWGVSNKILREHLYESTEDIELFELKKIEADMDRIKKWLEEENGKSYEKQAFELTIKAYDELGLWTWDDTLQHNK